MISHLPLWRNRRQDGATGRLSASHQPDSPFTSLQVTPKNIHLPIAVKVSRTRHLPFRCDRRENGWTSILSAVHQPDSSFPSPVVLPKNICASISVEIR